jgi:hypothetical protein
MLQEDDRPRSLRAVRQGAIGNAMHGEDIAVICGHGVGLSRVTVLCDQLRLNQFPSQETNNYNTDLCHSYISPEKKFIYNSIRKTSWKTNNCKTQREM